MKRSMKEVKAAVERIEAVACTNIGDAPRSLEVRPNDLRRLVDAIDDLTDSDAALRAEVRRLRADRATAFRLVSQMPGHALRQDVLAALAPRKPARRKP